MMVEVGGEDVRVSSPDRVVFPDQGWTKGDVVRHFVQVAEDTSAVDLICRAAGAFEVRVAADDVLVSGVVGWVDLTADDTQVVPMEGVAGHGASRG